MGFNNLFIKVGFVFLVLNDPLINPPEQTLLTHFTLSLFAAVSNSNFRRPLFTVACWAMSHLISSQYL
ncbi:hypothetical protein ACET3Z_019839 [Daucus carota]